MSRFLPAMLVAREILRLANADNPPQKLTPLKLIKLTYITHGWAYPCLGRRLIGDAVEAWEYGPVYPELYHAIKHHGRDSVETVTESAYEQLQKAQENEIHLEEDEEELIKVVYNAYKSLSGPQLVTLTHALNTPWDRTKSRNCEIDERTIEDYYNNYVKSD